jgi:carboxymethylenebutenolidase
MFRFNLRLETDFMGRPVSLTGKDGFRLGAYRAEPQTGIKGGVVICQEIFGVTGNLKSVCDFYAGAGYLTIAPQFFDRIERDVALDYTPEGRHRAEEFLTKAEWHVALDDLEVARQHLHSLGAGKVGVVGFCWGGTLAWLLACRRHVDCAVAYYGSEIDDFAGEHARHPVILHIGDADRVIPPDKLARIQKAQAATPIYIYANAPHGFDNSLRTGYDPATAELARQRTLEFLQRHVG